MVLVQLRLLMVRRLRVLCLRLLLKERCRLCVVRNVVRMRVLLLLMRVVAVGVAGRERGHFAVHGSGAIAVPICCSWGSVDLVVERLRLIFRIAKVLGELRRIVQGVEEERTEIARNARHFYVTAAAKIRASLRVKFLCVKLRSQFLFQANVHLTDSGDVKRDCEPGSDPRDTVFPVPEESFSQNFSHVLHWQRSISHFPFGVSYSRLGRGGAAGLTFN